MAIQSVTYQRRQDALKLLGDGYGCTESVTQLANRWGCSRRTARRYVAAAHQELISDLTHVEAATLLASLIDRLERIARKAEQDGQFAAAVGAVRTLAELAIAPNRNMKASNFGRFRGI
jgi:hypothetical protein